MKSCPGVQGAEPPGASRFLRGQFSYCLNGRGVSVMHRAEIKEAMGEWLGGLAPWDVFSTWTFSRPASVNGAMYWAHRHLDWLEKAAGGQIYAFVGAEQGNRGGLIHLHALVGNVGHLQRFCGTLLPPGSWGRTCCMVHSWPAGYARVLPYDPKQGAAFYVSKYVTKQLAEWELFGFPATFQPVLKVN